MSLAVARVETKPRILRVGLTLAAAAISLMLSACERTSRSPIAPSALAPTLPLTGAAAAPASAQNTIQAVSVDLVARSRRRAPMRDLDASQLSVNDNGTPVQLSSLRRVDVTPGSSNLGAFLFDRMNPGEAKAARKMAGKILSVIPEQGYSLAVLEVSGRLRLLQAYTQDFHAAYAALTAATAESVPNSTQVTPAETALFASTESHTLGSNLPDRTRNKMLLAALQESQHILEDRRSYPSLAALQALVQSHRAADGRKFVFYFCSGINSNSEARELLQSIVSLANRSGVTIYVVDVSPHLASMSSAMQASQASAILSSNAVTAFGPVASGGTPSGASGILAPALQHNFQELEFGSIDLDQSPLATLSSGTGGLYLSALEDSRQRLEQLHQELTTWYQATWMPPIRTYDGQFRPIEIHSHRKDLSLRTRTGYFAVPPSNYSEIPPFEVPLLKLLDSPTLPSALPIQAGIMHLGTLPDGISAELVVQVPVSQLEIHEDYNTHISSAQAAILAVIKDSKGAVLERFGEDIPLHQSPELFQNNSAQMITLSRSFSADPGTYTLEAVVNDQFGNKAGSSRQSFTIQPSSPHGPTLSDIALVQSMQPVEETRDNHDLLEPMRYRNGRVIPNFSNVLPANTSSLSLFLLLHPAAGSQSQPSLHMQIFLEDHLLTDMPMELQPISGTGGGIPYLATLHGTVFPPGSYQVKALLSQDGATSISTAAFHVGSSTAATTSFEASSPADSEGASKIEVSVNRPSDALHSSFTITAATDPVSPPTESETTHLIENARERALTWSDTLHNFLCLEVTNHFVENSGDSVWTQQGTLVERLQSVDHKQTRTTLTLNGEKSELHPDQLEFFHSNGEFGAMFHLIFDPSAKAVFTWKQAAFIEGQPIQIFAFKVARENSTFNLSDRGNHTAVVGFSGLLYIDPATGSVRRVTLAADDIPKRLLIRACSISVDYSWITMQNHDFLLPVRGAVGMQESGHHPVLNEFAFRDYRRFGSQVRILAGDQVQRSATD